MRFRRRMRDLADHCSVCLCVVLGVFTSTAIDKLTAIVHSDVSAARLAPYYAANKGSSPASVLAILLGNLLGQVIRSVG